MDVRVSNTTYLTSIQVTKGSEEEDDDLEEDFSNEKKKSEVGSSLFGKFALARKKMIKGKKSAFSQCENFMNFLLL